MPCTNYNQKSITRRVYLTDGIGPYVFHGYTGEIHSVRPLHKMSAYEGDLKREKMTKLSRREKNQKFESYRSQDYSKNVPAKVSFIIIYETFV